MKRIIAALSVMASIAMAHASGSGLLGGLVGGAVGSMVGKSTVQSGDWPGLERSLKKNAAEFNANGPKMVDKSA